MNSTTKAALISAVLLALLVIGAIFVLDDDAPPGGSDNGDQPGLVGDDVQSGVIGDGTPATDGGDIRPVTPRTSTEVTVEIVDANSGSRVKGAELQVLRATDSERSGDLIASLPRPGSARGAELKFNVEPGKYTLIARARGYMVEYDEVTVIGGSSEPMSRTIRLKAGTSISGHVYAKDGTPIAGAQVGAFRDLAAPDADLEEQLKAMIDLEKIQKETHYNAVSGPDGSYQIDGVTRGLYYTVRAVAADYSPASRSGVPAPSVDVDFRLEEGGVLEGIVRNEEGQPVEGAVVEAYIEPENVGLFATILAKSRPPVGKATTDSAGRYRLAQLGAGLYNFLVGGSGYQELEVTKHRVLPGGSNTKDFQLVRGETIRGIVLGPDDQPVSDAKVRVNQIGGAASGRDKVRVSLGDDSIPTDDQGRFAFDTLKPGSYMVIVWHADYQSVQRRDVRPSDEDLTINLLTGGQLEGGVFDLHSGDPIAGAIVSASDVANFRKEATTDKDGMYLLSGLNPSRRKVKVHVQADGFARESQTVKVTSGLSKQDFELRGSGTVIGLVTLADGTELPEARVEVRRVQTDTGTPLIVGHGETDGDGRFEIAGVDPGEGLRVRIKKRKYLDAYSEEFTVESGATVEVSAVEMRLGGAISGRVQDPAGRPVAGCTVSAHLPGDTEAVNQNISTTSLADGTYAIHGLQDGAVDLVFKATKFVETRLENVAVREGQNNTGQNVELEAAGVIAGKVVDSNGAGIGNAEIIVREFESGLKEHRAVSDAQAGTFFLQNVETKGQVSVEVRHPEFSSWEQEDVAVGTEDLEAVLQPLGTFIGQVFGPDGDAVINFTVQPQPQGSSSDARRARARLKAKNFSDGAFEYRGLPDGTYDIVVRSPDFSATTVANIPISAGEIVDLGRVDLSEGGRISGRVTSADGQPIIGAKVRVVEGVSRFTSRTEKTARSNQTTDANGEFLFTSLRNGSVTLEVTHGSYGRKSIPGVDPQNASSSQNIEIQLDEGGEIYGSVTDSAGNVVSGITVYLTAENRRTPTDPRGEFSFKNVSAGQHTVKAHKFVPGQTPLMDEKSVEVQAGSRAVVDLTVEAR